MNITPKDINNKEFKKGLRGYNVEEVDDYLDEIVESYDEVYRENSRLKDTLGRIKEKLDHYEKLEATIQNTLLLAQNTAEQAKQSAQRQAEIVVANANESAQNILNKAHSDVINITEEYEKVKDDFIKFRVKFRNFMNTQMETFDDLEKELNRNYTVSNVSNSVQELELKCKDIAEESLSLEVNLKKDVDEEFSNINFDDFKILDSDLTQEISEIKNFFANN